MLPDFMIAVFFAASAIFASSAADMPVVPMMCTSLRLGGERRELHGRGRNGEIEDAVGRERQRAHSLVTITRFGGRPASTPESCPSSGEPSPSVAPASITPRRLGDRLDERAPHAPAGAGHDQPHVSHGIAPAFRAPGIARQAALVSYRPAAGRHSPR